MTAYKAGSLEHPAEPEDCSTDWRVLSPDVLVGLNLLQAAVALLLLRWDSQILLLTIKCRVGPSESGDFQGLGAILSRLPFDLGSIPEGRTDSV